LVKNIGVDKVEAEMKLSALKCRSINSVLTEAVMYSLSDAESTLYLTNLVAGMGVNEGQFGALMALFRQIISKRFSNQRPRPVPLTDRDKNLLSAIRGGNPTFFEVFASVMTKTQFGGKAFDLALQQANGWKENYIRRKYPKAYDLIRWEMKLPNDLINNFNFTKVNATIAQLAAQGKLSMNPLASSREVKTWMKKMGMEGLSIGGGLPAAIMQLYEMAQLFWWVYKKIKHGEPLTDLDRFFKYKLTDRNAVTKLRDDVLSNEQEVGELGGNVPTPSLIGGPSATKPPEPAIEPPEPEPSQAPQAPQAPAPQAPAPQAPAPQGGDAEFLPGKVGASVEVPDKVPDPDNPEGLTPEQEEQLKKLLGK
jgi:hypothetical protein